MTNVYTNNSFEKKKRKMNNKIAYPENLAL